MNSQSNPKFPKVSGATRPPEHPQSTPSVGGVLGGMVPKAQNGTQSERPSDLLLETFGGSMWVETSKGGRWRVPPNGGHGAPPPDMSGPSHTAADMGAGPAVNPVAFAKPAPRKIRQGARA